MMNDQQALTESASTVFEILNDIIDELLSAADSPSKKVALADFRFKLNIAASAAIEAIEVYDSAVNGGDWAEDLAGALGAVLGGGFGAVLGTAMAAAIVAPLGLGAGATALAGVIVVPLIAGALGWLGETYGEWLWSERLSPWLEDLGAFDFFGFSDPLVIDMDGDGVELTALDGDPAYFDLDGDGFAERTGWVAPDDAILAIDLNGNGEIDDISELFGDLNTSGFAALEDYDDNGDGVIDASDAVFGDLLLWQDSDGDGVTDSGELIGVPEAGLAEISLTITGGSDHTIVQGNQIPRTAEVTWGDGTITTVADVNFRMSSLETVWELPDDFEFDAEVIELPWLRGFGEVRDSWVEMSEDSALKARAQSLMTLAAAGNLTGFKTEFDQYLFDWAGVSGTQWLDDMAQAAVLFVRDEDDGIAGYMIVDSFSDFGTKLPDWRDFLRDMDGSFNGEDWLGNQVSPPQQGSGGGGGTQYLYDGVGLSYGSASGSDGSGNNGQSFTLPPTASHGLSPEAFAFLQAMAGRSINTGMNVLTMNGIAAADLSPDDATELQSIFDDARESLAVRFLVQADNAALAADPDATMSGLLAATQHLDYHYFTDKVAGDIESFVVDAIGTFRSEGLGSDLEALEFVAMFASDLDPAWLTVYTVKNFPELDAQLVSDLFGGPDVHMGTSADDDLIADQGNLLLMGRDGNDAIEGSSGADTFFGGQGDDRYLGGHSSDIYLVDKDQGDDRVIEWGNYTNDRIIFADDITLEDLNGTATDTDGNGHLDLTVSFLNGTGSITLEEVFRGDISNAHNRQIDWFEFNNGIVLSHEEFFTAVYHSGTDGDDAIEGTRNGDTFIDSLGDDRYRGGIGHDTYFIDKDQGDDRILEWGNYNDDRIIFADGISLDDLQGTATDTDGNGRLDLTVSFLNGDGSITLEEVFRDDYSAAHERQIDWFEFSDGTELRHEDFFAAVYHNGTDGDDAIEGTKNSDTFIGGLGDDRYRGGHGNDRYLVDKDQGDDRILDWGNYSDDRIVFADGITLNDLQGSTTDTDGNGRLDFTISFLNGSGSITIEEVFLSENWAHQRQIDWFEFSDGTELTHEEFFAAIYHNGTDGDDVLYGIRGNDTFTGSLGNDRYIGGYYSDRYIIDKDQGDDRIIESGNYSGDRIVFADGIALSDLGGSATDTDGNGHLDLTISFLDGTGSITIEEVFRGESWAYDRQIDWFEFNDGTELSREEFFTAVYHSGTNGDDVLYGIRGNDTFIGSIGDDRYEGGRYSDTYVLDKNQGHDRIIEGWNYSGDRIIFADGIVLSDLQGAATDTDGNGHLDLTVSFVNGSGSITIEEVFRTDVSWAHDRQVDWFEFSDGTELSHEEFFAAVYHNGTDGDDVLYGTRQSDTFSGSLGDDELLGKHGNDRLAGGKGDDTLNGGSGTDTFVFSIGDGLDVVEDFANGSERIDLVSTGTQFSDLSISDDGQGNAVIVYGVGDEITVLNAAGLVEESDFVFAV
ncbi:MAG: calcium-binding protein [Pseudomonadota bacterium]